MKVYICSDIEGVANLAVFDEARSENPSYQPMAVEMSRETAAACRGALKGGAEEVVLEDSHGNGRNIIPEYLPKEVKLLRGVTHDVFSVTSIFDASFDCILFIGMHDCAGGNGNPTCHTMVSSLIHEIKINGELVGEFEVSAFAAANIGIPVIFVSGDEETCRKAAERIPEIGTVATKTGRGSAVLATSAPLVLERIEKSVEYCVRNFKNKKDVLNLPNYFKVEVTYNKQYDAYKYSHYPDTTLISPYTIAFESDRYSEVMRFFYFVM